MANGKLRTINWWIRKLHRWGAIAMAVPLAVVVCSGLLLQVKKQVPWIQPPTSSGSQKTPQLAWETILEIARSQPAAEVSGWNDIDRLDVRPGKGIVKIRCRNMRELQVDTATGEILSSTLRRSDLIESIHDGSFFSDYTKLWLFLPNGFVLLGLWITGMYLWYLPIGVKRGKRLRQSIRRERI